MKLYDISFILTGLSKTVIQKLPKHIVGCTVREHIYKEGGSRNQTPLKSMIM
jgi:hypothetical protein